MFIVFGNLCSTPVANLHVLLPGLERRRAASQVNGGPSRLCPVASASENNSSPKVLGPARMRHGERRQLQSGLGAAPRTRFAWGCPWSTAYFQPSPCCGAAPVSDQHEKYQTNTGRSHSLVISAMATSIGVLLELAAIGLCFHVEWEYRCRLYYNLRQ